MAAAAAISLGKLRAHDAAPKLAAMLESNEWQRRGAGALALGWLRNRDATDLIIKQMDDKDPTVRATVVKLLVEK